MDRPSVPARLKTEAASSGQEETGGAAGSAAEAPPQRLAQVGFQGAGLLARIGKDVTEEMGLERRDTTDSFLSDFSQHRTNTGWSIAASTATDLTDLNSPDVAFADDSLEGDTEIYASSPRRSGLFPRPIPFKRLPLHVRAPSISCDADRSRGSIYGSSPDSLAPRHRRLDQITSRKASLNRYPSPTTPTGSSARREPTPLGPLEPLVTETGRRSDNVDKEGDRSGDGDDASSSTGGTSRGPRPQTQAAAPENQSAGEDGRDADANSGDDAPTPGQNLPERGLIEPADALAAGFSPDRRRSSSSGEASDSADEDEVPPASAPDDSIVYDVCEQVLQLAFGVQLHEVALAGAMPAAYESVSHLLDELSHILLNNGLGNTGIMINESTRGGTGSGSVAIWPAGGAGGSGGAGGGNGGGYHGRKRSNAGQEGTNPGDGAGDGSHGGGKRQKVSPADDQLPDMHFSCPFRKRNPVRFNVRDFRTCALQPFPDMPQLKRHVKHFHQQKAVLPFTCQRCRRAMGSQEALDRHVLVGRDEICSPQKVPSSADPEDGITSSIEEVLNGRKSGTKIDSWESLWRLLFSGDTEIPEADFIPPTELEEVQAEFNTDNCTRQLRQRIQQGLGPGASIESLVSVVRNHIESVFDTCRQKTSGRAVGRRRLGIHGQTWGGMSSRRGSVKSNPGRPTSRGRGSVDSNFSSAVATPNSSAMLGGFDQSLIMAEASPGMPSAPVMMPFVTLSSPNPDKGVQPVTVPPAAHVHVGFGSQGPSLSTADTLGGQLGHHFQSPHLPTDSGFELSTAGCADQGVGVFSAVPSFAGSQVYQGLGLGHPMLELSLRPPPGPPPRVQGVQGMQEQMFSPTDASMIPTITFFEASAAGDGLDEAVRRSSVWSDGFP